MSDVAVYQFPTTGQQIRTIDRDGEPWFVAADVCAALDIANPRAAVATLDPDETVDHGVASTDTLTVKLVSEAGLYSLILRSRKPEAKAFKRWITHEVLPTIRRTGAYAVARLGDPLDEMEAANDRAMRAVAIARQERADRIAAEQRATQLAPKAQAYDVFIDTSRTYSLAEVAKLLYSETGLGRNQLAAELRKLKILRANLEPYQRYVDYFELKTIEGGYAAGRVATRVTAAGVELIRQRLGNGQAALVPVPDRAAVVR